MACFSQGTKGPGLKDLKLSCLCSFHVPTSHTTAGLENFEVKRDPIRQRKWSANGHTLRKVSGVTSPDSPNMETKIFIYIIA